MDQEPITSPAPITAPPVTALPDMSTVPAPSYTPQPEMDANQNPMRFVMPVNPSGWCIVAGYLGLFSVLLVFAPFALLAGLMGIRDLKLHPTKTGRGRAWFGTVMGTVFTVLLVLLLAQLSKS